MTAPKPFVPPRALRLVLLGTAAAALSACAQSSGDVSAPPSSAGAPPPAAAAAPPPATGRASGNGIVTYADYAAVVAQPGDTVASMAGRAGLDPSELAAYNGLPLSYVPSPGDELVLPPRPGGYASVAAAPAAPAAPAPPASDPSVAAAPSGADPITGWSPAAVNQAIDGAPADAAAAPQTGRVVDGAGISRDVVYHDVREGETVYSIARDYGLPADTLIAWNALAGPNYPVRPGEVLTVPAGGPPPVENVASVVPTVPGEGGAAAPPPSAGTPLPPDTVAPQPLASPELGQFQTRPPSSTGAAAEVAAASPQAIEPTASTEAPSVASLAAPEPEATGKLAAPVPGPIVKRYSREPGPNRNDGVDFAAEVGEEVRAAAAGEVALVSTSLGEWGTIVLLRHPDGLMTVYGRLGRASVEKGQQLAAGQVLGVVGEPSGSRPLMHFEVRRGAFSENPEDFL